MGFAFARLRFRGSKVLFYLLIVTMLIPWQALMVPQFLFFVKLGWYGTYLPLIVPSFLGIGVLHLPDPSVHAHDPQGSR